MAAKRTLGWISGLTLVTVMAGCASQTPSMTAPDNRIPNTGPAIIDGDTLIVPSSDLTVQLAPGTDGMKMESRWNAKDFANLPKRIEAAGAAQQGLISSGALSSMYPGAFNMNFPGVWPGSWAGAQSYCPSPYGFAFGTPGVFPKTLFIHPDVYYYRRNALYFPYSRLGGYFYPISVPYGSRFYTPMLAYGFGGLSPYTYTSATCPIGQAFPGQLPVGPALGGGGYLPPGQGPGMGDGHVQQQYGKQHSKQQKMGSRSY